MKQETQWDVILQCVQKKRNQNVFKNIFYKTQAIMMKFGTQFPE